MSGSSVPEAARAAKAASDARLDRWFGAYCEAKALGGSGRAGLYRLMALADAEVAAASVELQQEVDRLSAECEALRGTVAEERAGAAAVGNNVRILGVGI